MMLNLRRTGLIFSLKIIYFCFIFQIWYSIHFPNNGLVGLPVVSFIRKIGSTFQFFTCVKLSIHVRRKVVGRGEIEPSEKHAAGHSTTTTTPTLHTKLFLFSFNFHFFTECDNLTLYLWEFPWCGLCRSESLKEKIEARCDGQPVKY